MFLLSLAKTTFHGPPRSAWRGALVAGLLLAAAGCQRRYVEYVSPARDFACQAPGGWAVVVDAAGSDYHNIIFVGPFEPEFYRATPSLSVRWHRYGAQHRLPDGTFESYSSADDFMTQMLRDVYGHEAFTKSGADSDIVEAMNRQVILPDARRVKVSGHEALYFVVYRNMPAPEGRMYGVVRSDAGERVVLQRHGYAIVPLKEGFYVLVYPATRGGFEKYRPQFYNLINSMRILKDGPAGPALKAPPEGEKAAGP